MSTISAPSSSYKPRKAGQLRPRQTCAVFRNYLRRPGCSSHSHPQSSQRVQILMRTGPPGRCELHIGAVLVQAQAAARDGEIREFAWYSAGVPRSLCQLRRPYSFLASNSLAFNSPTRLMVAASVLPPCQTGCPKFEHQPFVVGCPRLVGSHFGGCNPGDVSHRFMCDPVSA